MPDQVGVETTTEPQSTEFDQFYDAEPSQPAAAPAPDVAPASEPTKADEAPAPQPDSTGRPRDEGGRFTKGQAPAAKTPPPADTPADPETPTPEEVAEPEAPAVDPDSLSPEERKQLHYRFRAANAEQDLFPGSLVGDDGVFIPKDAVPQLTRLLEQGYGAQVSVPKRLEQAAHTERQLKAEIDASQAKWNQLTGHFDGLLEKSHAELQNGTNPLETSLARWLMNQLGNFEVLKAKADAEGIRRQSAATAERLQQYESRDREAEQAPLIDQTLQDHLEAYGEGLEVEDLKELYGDLQQNKAAWLVKAPRDIPEAGIKQGELVVDREYLRREVGRIQRWKQRYGTKAGVPQPAPAAVQQKVAAAKVANAKAAVTTKPPPAVPARAGQAPGKPKKGRTDFASDKQYTDYIFGEGMDD